MATYRCFRCGVFRTTDGPFTGDHYTATRSIQLIGSTGDDLVQTVGGTFRASGEWTTDVAANAWDNNDSTSWTVPPSTLPYLGWNQWDFGTPQDVRAVRFYPHSTNPANGYYVQASNDGVHYDWILPFTDAQSVTDWNEFDVTLPMALDFGESLGALHHEETGWPTVVGLHATANHACPWFEFTGPGSLKGHVYVDPTTPVRRRVDLYALLDGRLIASRWSDPVTGVYRFDNLSLGQKFFVMTHDYERNFNAVVKDILTPEVLP